jgi:hypothetical protein
MKVIATASAHEADRDAAARGSRQMTTARGESPTGNSNDCIGPERT